jgi:hypothetical protein
MKNFPEQDPLDDIVKRLGDYSDVPDDAVWNNVKASLRPKARLRLFLWMDGISGLLVIALFSFFWQTYVEGNIGAENLTRQTVAKNQANENLTSLERAESRESLAATLEKARGSSRVRRSSNKERSLLLTPEKTPVQLVGEDSKESLITGIGNPALRDIAEFVPKSDTVVTLAAGAESSKETVLNAPANSEYKKLRKRRLAMYGQFTPLLSFQRVTPVSSDGIVVKELVHRSLLSTGRLAFSFEGGIQGWLTGKLQYHAGVSLYKQSQTLEYRYASGDVSIETTGDREYIVSPRQGVATVHYNMTNIGANVGLIYFLYGKQLLHKVGGGFSYQHGMGNRNSEIYDNAASSYLSYRIFYRNELHINPRLSIYIQPTFNHAFYVQEDLDAPFRLKPYSAGVGFGMVYKF